MGYRQLTQELRLGGVLGESIDWTHRRVLLREGKGRLAGTNIINPGLVNETVNGADENT